MYKTLLILGCCVSFVPVASAQEVVVVDGAPVVAYEDAAASPMRFYARGEYLLWWIKDAPAPVPLIVTGGSPVNQTPQLGVPGVVTLMGGTDLDNDLRSGGRFTVGMWDRAAVFGLEGNYFFLGSQGIQQAVGSDGSAGSTLLTLPFFDATTGSESSTRVALPGGFSGVAVLTIDSSLYGFEANGLANVARGRGFRLDLLTGFRYLDLREKMSFLTDSVTVVGNTDVFRTLDTWATSNQFYGGQLGFKLEQQRGRFSFGSTVKVAFGSVHEQVDTLGLLATNDFNGLGPVQFFPAGNLNAPTNNGTQSEDRFAVVPQVDLNVGFDLTSFARLTFGYSFLYISDVVRPGDQVNRVLNPSQYPAITGGSVLVGTPQPAPLFNPSDFWAQGLNFGVELRY